MTRAHYIHRPQVLRAQRRHRQSQRAVGRMFRPRVERPTWMFRGRLDDRRCARRFRFEIAAPVALGVYLLASLIRAAL